MSGPMSGAVRPEQPRPPADLSGHTVGVIGLGTMGAAMAHRLLACGATVRAWTRDPARLAAFADQAVPTPESTVDGAGLVLVSVADDAALREVLAGVLPAAPLVVNASTVAPETVRDLAGRGPLLDAGVLGNATHARDGLLRWYVGGGKDLLDTARPVLEALGRQVLHVGDVGSGMVLKLAMNQLMGLEMQALAEVVLGAEAGGLDRQLVLDAVADSGFAAPVMRFKARRMAAGTYQRPDFRLVLMAKDLALAVGGHADRLPMSAAASRTHDDAVRAGLGEADCAAILAGLETVAAQGVS
jgi:3-hydroxyisobutyrate dehydrogenase